MKIELSFFFWRGGFLEEGWCLSSKRESHRIYWNFVGFSVNSCKDTYEDVWVKALIIGSWEEEPMYN
jgi:hypothetical protein